MHRRGNFSSATNIYVSRGFRCSLNATDKPNVAVNARLLAGHGRRQHGLRQVMRDELHWLRVTDRINYKLCLLVYKALHGFAPDYLSELCIPTSSVNYRSHLRSAHQDLIVPRVRLARYRPLWWEGICLCCTMRLELLTNWPERLQLVACGFKRRFKSYFLTRHNL